MDKKIQQSFVLFKPVCEKLATNTSSESVNEIQRLVKITSKEIIDTLQSYILFPLVLHLRNKSLREEFRRTLVDTMNMVLKKSHVDAPDIFFKYYSALIYQIFDKSKPGTVADCSEELKLSVTTAITSLFLVLLPSAKAEIYKNQNAPQFGQGIFLCVHIAKKELFRQLRIAAIRCIQAITSVHDKLINDDGNISDPFLDSTIGDILMFFLPGVLGALQEVANGDDKQGHEVTVVALTTIHRILCATMKDLTVNESKELTDEDFIALINITKQPNVNKSNIEPKAKIDNVKSKNDFKLDLERRLKHDKRDAAWYKMAGDKLVVLLKSLVPLCSHPHHKVRSELATLCNMLIKKCARNMMLSMGHILEILITLSEDEDTDVGAIALRGLGYFTSILREGSSYDLANLIQDNLNSILMKLPRYLNNLDSNKKLSSLNLLCGYLRVMTDASQNHQKLTQSVSNEHFLEKFIFVLLEVVRLETTNIRILEQLSVRDIEAPISNAIPWKCFTHLNNSKCINKITEICHLLGSSEAVDLICDHLMYIFSSKDDSVNEATFLLNEIIAGEPDKSSFRNHLIQQLIDAYTEPDVWYQHIEVGTKERPLTKNDTLDVNIYNPRAWEKDSVPGLYEGATETRYMDISYKDDIDMFESNNVRTLARARKNILHMCLMTEGVGLMAKCLGIDFQPYLLKMLYLVLERAGSNYEMIHLSGMKALLEVAHACGLQDITDLIRINSDYFTHQVTMKLKRVTENDSALQVLSVVMNYSDVRILPCLYNIVINVLLQSGNYSHRQTITYLRVFHTFIKCVRKWHMIPSERITPDQKDCHRCGMFDELYEYKKNKEDSEKLLSNDEYLRESGMSAKEMFEEDLKKKHLEDDSTDDITNPEDAAKPPQYIEMVVTVLKRSLNFLPNADRDQKLLILETINHGVVLLKDYENELLPLVHLIWSPLVVRFTELKQPVILNRAFQVLVTLGEVSKDFIRSRTLKEVLPSICKFLTSSSKESFLKDTGSWYRYSQAYKLQLSLLEGLGNLAVSLKLQEKDLYDILSCTESYLNSKQPKTLQKAACDLFKTLMKYDPDVVFLHLKSLYSTGEIQPPKCNIKLKVFAVRHLDITSKNDYRSNVEELLTFLNTIL